jgi:hypothetical protein
MHPLDTIKTRIQANIASNWKAIFSRETARSLGKGFFVSAMGAAGQVRGKNHHLYIILLADRLSFLFFF